MVYLNGSFCGLEDQPAWMFMQAAQMESIFDGWGFMEKLILVVDDSTTNLFIARNMLSEDYQVITLSSAEKMFAILKKVKPDLILLDIEMPEMDGFEALKLLKADAEKSSIPVIFLTVMNDPEIEARGLGLGAMDFLYKPLSKSTLLERIKPHVTKQD